MITLGSGTTGGGGGGAVTSVGSNSNSLNNLSAPNPIVGAGVIDFEVQIIDINLADARADEAANKLLEGVIYRITDFNKVLKVQTLATAEFMCIKNTAGLKNLSTTGDAFDVTDNPFRIKYDLQTDKLYAVEFQRLNQYAERDNASIRNCIENFRFNDISYANSKAIECDMFTTAGTVFKDSICQYGNVIFTFAGQQILNSQCYGNIQFQFNANATIDQCFFGLGSQLSPDDNLTNVQISPGAAFSVLAGSPVLNATIGNGINPVAGAGFPNTTGFVSDFNQQAAIQLFTAAANPEQIVSCLNSEISVNIDATAIPVGYQLNFPQFTFHKQVINIGFDGAYANALGLVSATFQVGGIFIPLAASQKGQCIRYIFDFPTATWFLA